MLLKNKLLKQWKAYSLVLAGVYTLELRIKFHVGTTKRRHICCLFAKCRRGIDN